MPSENRFWFHPRFDGLALFKARFRRHRYASHTHPTYVVALITGGCELLRWATRPVLAPAGSVFVVNPEEWHSGEAGGDEGWAYRSFYPSVELIDRLAEELGQPRGPVFPRGLLHDPDLAHALSTAHRASLDAEPAAAEAAFLVALRRLILRHADRRPRPEPLDRVGSRRRVALYEHLIEDALTDHLDLQRLAVGAGVTRFQVIRDFKAIAGVTPGAFIRDRRLRRASGLMTRGAGLADAATAAGFSDQSHFTRTFRAAHGVAPGSFSKAARDHLSLEDRAAV